MDWPLDSRDSPARKGLGPGYTYWLSADRALLRRINRLNDDALRDPGTGIGKAEPLRHMLAGALSRRISEEHRLVYLVDGDNVVTLQARFHYK